MYTRDLLSCCVILMPQVKLSGTEIREMSRDKIVARSTLQLHSATH